MKHALTIAILLSFCLATATAWSAPPATTTISAAAKKQPAVPFSHEKHLKRVPACDTCHHVNKGMTAATEKNVQKCSACHLDPKPGVLSMREMNMQKNPFHVTCVNCHKQQKKGPVTCTACHVKK